MAEYSYIREIQIRFKKKRVKGQSIKEPIINAEQVVVLFSDMQNETKEKLITISLDKSMKILCFEVVAIGAVDSVYARPVEMIRGAIPFAPYGLIIVHNHPSGDPIPSKDDIRFTGELMNETNSLGIDFCDHIIIGDGKFVSFANMGLIKEFQRLLKKSDDKLNSALQKKAEAVASKLANNK